MIGSCSALIASLIRLTAVGVAIAAAATAALATVVIHGGLLILAAPVWTPADVIHTDPQFVNRTIKSDPLPLASEAPTVTTTQERLVVSATQEQLEAIVLDRRGLLNDVQIAAIKTRLRLTPAQQQHWPAVEIALREFAYRFLQPKKKRPIRITIDAGSPQAQKLVQTATPLLNELREDQKRELRQLIRIIGLETVASRI